MFYLLHETLGKRKRFLNMLENLSEIKFWATDWTIGVPAFDSRRGLGIFLFTTASRTALVPT
jgi:hypothetical protein